MKKQALAQLKAAVKAAPALTPQAIANCYTFHHRSATNADGTPLRAKRNGHTQKTRPGQFKIPVKHGLKTHFYITPENAHQWAASIEVQP